MIQYLSRNTWPDIKLFIDQFAHHTHNPKFLHEISIKCICCYLKVTIAEGLIFKPSDVLNMDCYVETDHAGLWHVYNPE